METVNYLAGIGKPARKDPREGDYYDDENFLMCGKCNTRRQTLGFRDKKVYCLCKCDSEKYEEEERLRKADERARNIKRLRKDGITDPRYLRFTFANDDRRNAEVSNVCMKYVEKWNTMWRRNYGIMFYGDTGTGKSFFASCIANALLEKEVSVIVTSIPSIIAELQGASAENREYTMDRIQNCSLLVLDDLGVEALTQYRMEQTFMIFDARQRSCRPLIVTTNLTPEMMDAEQNIATRRIYDRVLGMCQAQIPVNGDSRRREKAKNSFDDLKGLLEIGK